MFVIPRLGVLVLDPATREFLPPEGRDVPDNAYWRAALARLDVTLGSGGGTPPPVVLPPPAAGSAVLRVAGLTGDVTAAQLRGTLGVDELTGAVAQVTSALSQTNLVLTSAIDDLDDRLVVLEAGGTPPPPAGSVAASVTQAATASGTPAVGQVLTGVAATFAGTPAPTVVNEWRRGGTVVATTLTYAVQAGDAGALLTFRSIGSNGVGSPAVSIASSSFSIPAAAHTITATPGAPFFATNSPVDSTITVLSAVPAGFTRTHSPADGRLTLAPGGTALRVGGSASSVGDIPVSIIDTPTGGGATVTLSFTVQVTAPQAVGAWQYDPAEHARQSIPTSPVAGVRFAEPTLQPSAANDVLGFNFNSKVALPAHTAAWGQIFHPGQVQPTDVLETVWGGQTRPLHFDPKTFWPDGSVEHAVLAQPGPVMAGAAGRGQVVQALIRRGGTAAPGAPLTITNADIGNFELVLEVVSSRPKRGPGQSPPETPVGVIHTINAAALASAFAASYWTRSALFAVRRFVLNLSTGNMRIKGYVYKAASGEVRIGWQVLNDRNMRPNPNRIFSYLCNFTFRQGGTTIVTGSHRVAQGEGLYKETRSDFTAAQNAAWEFFTYNIQPDLPHLIQSGAVPPMTLQHGLNESAITSTANGMADDPLWRRPGGRNGSFENMPAGSGRPDLGLLPKWHGDYLLSADADVRRQVLGHALGSFAYPVRAHDEVNDVALNIFPGIGHPNAWAEPRGQISIYQGGGFTEGDQTEVNEDGSGGEIYETAHNPAWAYLPYLLTGDPLYADLLEEQANFALRELWDLLRTKTVGGVTRDWCTMQTNQVRQSGIITTDVGYAARLLPEGNTFKPWFRQVLEFTFAFLNSRVPTWKAIQGETAGWLPNSAISGGEDLKLWQDDRVAWGTWSAYQARIEGAYAFIRDFNGPFHIGRAMQHPGIFDLGAAGAYIHKVYALRDIETEGVNVTTWQQLGRVRVGSGLDGGGDYMESFQQSVALCAIVLRSAQGRLAHSKILALNYAPLTPAALRFGSTYVVAPPPPAISLTRRITVTQPFADVLNGSAATGGGTLFGYTTAPSLAYAINGGAWTPVPGGGVTAAGFTLPLTGLGAGFYRVVVRDVNNTRVEAAFDVFGVIVPPDPYTNPVLLSATSNAIKFRVTEPASGAYIENGEYQWRQGTGPWSGWIDFQELVTVTQGSLPTASAPYQFQVRAVNPAGPGPVLDFTFSTVAAAPAGAPARIFASAVPATQVPFVFDPSLMVQGATDRLWARIRNSAEVDLDIGYVSDTGLIQRQALLTHLSGGVGRLMRGYSQIGGLFVEPATTANMAPEIVVDEALFNGRPAIWVGDGKALTSQPTFTHDGSAATLTLVAQLPSWLPSGQGMVSIAVDGTDLYGDSRNITLLSGASIEVARAFTYATTPDIPRGQAGIIQVDVLPAGTQASMAYWDGAAGAPGNSITRSQAVGAAGSRIWVGRFPSGGSASFQFSHLSFVSTVVADRLGLRTRLRPVFNTGGV